MPAKKKTALDAEIDAVLAEGGPPARVGGFFRALWDAFPVCRVGCKACGECGTQVKPSGDRD